MSKLDEEFGGQSFQSGKVMSLEITQDSLKKLNEFAQKLEVNQEGEQPSKTKEERISDLSESLLASFKEIQKLKEEQKPYKEHIKDAKKNYVENGWLEKDEVSLVEKTVKMVAKTGGDIELDEMGLLKEIIMPIVEKNGRIE